MQIQRTEIRTGLLVVVTLVAVVAVLIYLGAPGVFIPQNTFRIYFDNASGIKPGSQVLLAGRKIGQVQKLFSPVPEGERPDPKLETMIEVQVASSAQIYKVVKVQITQPSLLGDSVIDFSSGQEGSGRAPDGFKFIGERPGGLADVAPAVLSKLDPLLEKLGNTLESLQKTSDNVARLTQDGADLPKAFSEFKDFSKNLNDLTAYGGPLRNSLQNLETLTSDQGKLGQSLTHLAELTAPEGPLSKTFKNTEQLTSGLANNKDIDATLHNFRAASDNLNQRLTEIGHQFSNVGNNLEVASDLVKRQPWRLIWPTTKKYPEQTAALAAPATPTPKPVTSSKKKGASSR